MPNRDSVLGQGFWLDPVDRKRRLPDEAMWPPELDEHPSEGRNRFVMRRSVFGIAERVIETPYDPFSATASELAKVAGFAKQGQQRPGGETLCHIVTRSS